jgi:hypothetical protein
MVNGIIKLLISIKVLFFHLQTRNNNIILMSFTMVISLSDKK